MSEAKYLAVKNWEKYQGGTMKRDWVKAYVKREDDKDWQKLTCLQRCILEGVWRLRGRLGKNVPNDAEYIGRALQVLPVERKYVGRAIGVLTMCGFLIPSNQQDGFTEERRGEDINREEKRGKRAAEPAPPKTSTPKTYSPTPPAEVLPPTPEPTTREVSLGLYKPSPEGLPPMVLAMGLAEQIHMPETNGNKMAVEAAIKAWSGKLSKIRGHPVSHAQACDDLIEKAHAAQARGEKVDKWWFEDAKYDPENGNGRDHKAAVAVERQQRTRENILAGLGLSDDAGDVAGQDDDAVQGTTNTSSSGRVVETDTERLRPPRY